MTPRTEAAISNLREGIKKMEGTMNPAAQVRRAFRLGRPPKPADPQQLHPNVAWQKAQNALSDLRGRMVAAGLNPAHVTAAIVFIAEVDPDQPNVLLLEMDGKASEQRKAEAFEQLGRNDVITLGMIFSQFDDEAKQQFTFPFQFMGLNERGIACAKEGSNVAGQRAKAAWINQLAVEQEGVEGLQPNDAG